MATSRKAIEFFSIAAIVAIGALTPTFGVVSAADIFVGPGETYTTIQSAVSIATPFDTIIVRDSIYTENIDVTVDNVTICSENGSESCIVNTLDSNDHVFEVIADYVNISGFTVQNATGSEKAGICLNNVEHCTISENTALNNYYYGIYLSASSNNALRGNTASNNTGSGIYLFSSSNNNTLNGNIAANNYRAIYLGSSSTNNTLTGNSVSNNTYGIWLYASSSNHLTGNTAYSNNYGILLSSSSTNTLTDNSAFDNNNGIYVDDSSNNTLTGNSASNNSRGIYLSSSSYNSLTDNSVSNNYDGILLSSSSNNTLSSNTATSNDNIGILFVESRYNQLTNNTISNNGKNGICLRKSFYNTLRNNSMSNNFFFNFVIRDAVTLEEWNNTIDESNTANELPVYFFYKQSDLVIESYATNKIGIVGCTNVTLRNITFSGGDPIAIIFTSDSIIENCTITNNNAAGFVLMYSHNNSLVNNTASQNLVGFNIANSTNSCIRDNSVTENAEYGIELRNCSNNLIYNNYFENSNNAYDDGNNLWNITRTFGTNIVGGSFLGGNYWSDYTGEDLGDDGIGDTQLPYNSSDYIVNGGDYRPLVKRTHGFELQLASGYNMISIPVNDSLAITASDLAAKIGTSCTEVVRWDGTSQAYVSHIPGLPLNNFATTVGDGYFVNVNNPTSVTFEGPGWASPCIVSLLSGYNMIGVPVNDSSVTTASTLATKIGTSCTEVVRWDGNTQSYISHIPGLPLNDFAIMGGQGYFVNVNNPVDVSFAGESWEN